MPRTRKDCPLCGKKDLCKLSNHLADTHRLSSRERRVYLDNAKSPYAKEDYDIMPRTKRARMDYCDQGATTSSDNGDIFDSDEGEESGSEEEESSSKEKESSEENNEKEDSSEEDGSSEDSERDDQSAEDEEDPWQSLIDEAKRQLLDEFQENVGNLKNEGFSDVEAKKQSFSALLPKLTKALEDVYLDHAEWMSDMRKDPVHKKIMETRKRFVEEDSFDPEEAMLAAIEKRKFLFQRILEERQHFSDSDGDDAEVQIH